MRGLAVQLRRRPAESDELLAAVGNPLPLGRMQLQMFRQGAEIAVPLVPFCSQRRPRPQPTTSTPPRRRPRPRRTRTKRCAYRARMLRPKTTLPTAQAHDWQRFTTRFLALAQLERSAHRGRTTPDRDSGRAIGGRRAAADRAAASHRGGQRLVEFFLDRHDGPGY